MRFVIEAVLILGAFAAGVLFSNKAKAEAKAAEAVFIRDAFVVFTKLNRIRHKVDADVKAEFDAVLEVIKKHI